MIRKRRPKEAVAAIKASQRYLKTYADVKLANVKLEDAEERALAAGVTLDELADARALIEGDDS